MSFLDSEKAKAIRWFRNFADLLENGQADLASDSLSKEDYGSELRLSGTLIPTKRVGPRKEPRPERKEEEGTPTKSMIPRITDMQASQAFDVETRLYTCPRCKKFQTKSATGLKKHHNRCQG